MPCNWFANSGSSGSAVPCSSSRASYSAQNPDQSTLLEVIALHLDLDIPLGLIMQQLPLTTGDTHSSQIAHIVSLREADGP